MKFNDNDLKLIYVQKVGHNTKGDGLYEFIFSTDPTNIDMKGWCWDMSPACDYVLPPTKNFINLTVQLKTQTFDLFCLHESVEREYMHGYYTIHALAYEIEKEFDIQDGFDDYENLFEKKSSLPMTLISLIIA